MSRTRGVLGEERVKRLLWRLPDSTYRVGNNVLIETNTRKGFSQIDHVVVSPYGLFVIETKNYKGIITGHEQADKWKQTINGKVYTISNPVKQNISHIRALKRLLIPDVRFISVICFIERSDVHVTTRHAEIVQAIELLARIKGYTRVFYTKEQVDYMVDKIRESHRQVIRNNFRPSK